MSAPRPDSDTQVAWRSGARSPEQTRVLREVADRVGAAVMAAGKGPMPVVTFDLDSTLFDNRPRQLAILSAFAQAHGLGGVDALTIEDVDGWRVAELVPRLSGGSPDLASSFKPFWRDRFFTSEFCRHDVALPGASEFVREVERAGAQIVYLTGRHEDMRQGTADSLKEGGFPVGTILMKPTFEMTDTQWKEIAVARLRETGPVVASFDNEPTHVNRLKSAFPDAVVVWLRTDHSPETEPVAGGTPSVCGFLL